MSEMPVSEPCVREMSDPSPTVIWFPSLVQSESESSGRNEERRKPKRVHATRSDRSRRAEDERARLIRLIG